jgi:hypothetical protein
MNRWLRIALIVVAAFAFTILAEWAEPRHSIFGSVLFLGYWIVFAIYFVLHLDFFSKSPVPYFLTIACNTLLYSWVFGMLLRLCKRRPRRHD